ncbi:MAG: sigma-70 family RNA polymerase sigma factor [Flavobacteriales bacterium]|nr:sigma-70 family RNA polymerase sigma factor [Flavobacteriales bacterium]
MNRDESVVAELYDAFSGNLYGLMCKMVHDEALAADLLQEGFVKIWKYGAKYDPKHGSLFTWMMNICRNGTIDHLRSKKRRNEIHDLSENVYSSEAGNQITQNTDTLDLREKVAQLEPDLRNLIELAYFGGFTQKEISENLDLPLGTVKTRMRKGMKELRAIFGVRQ